MVLQLIARQQESISQASFLIVIYLTIFIIDMQGVSIADCNFSSRYSCSILYMKRFSVGEFSLAGRCNCRRWWLAFSMHGLDCEYLAGCCCYGRCIVFSLYENRRETCTDHRRTAGNHRQYQTGDTICFQDKNHSVFYFAWFFSVMFGGVMAILPIYAEDILHVGAEGLGICGQHLRSALLLHYYYWHGSLNAACMEKLLIAVTDSESPFWYLLSHRGWDFRLLCSSSAVRSIASVSYSRNDITGDDSRWMRGRVLAVNGISLLPRMSLVPSNPVLLQNWWGQCLRVFGGVVTLLIVTWVYFRTGELKSIEVKKFWMEFYGANQRRAGNFINSNFFL